MRRALALAGALVFVLGAQSLAASPSDPGTYWLGPSFAGLPLTHEDGGFYVYGDCKVAPGEESCSPPLQIQNTSACDRNPVALDVPPRRFFRVRGGGIAAEYPDNANSVDLTTGRRTVTVYGETQEQSRQAVRSLRRRSQAEPVPRLDSPVYPRAVKKELKRILVARRRHRTTRAIARETGVPRHAVRTRLKLARLLGSRALSDVEVPKRSWRLLERDRQIVFSVNDYGVETAARDFGISRSAVRRAMRRVRGLVGDC